MPGCGEISIFLARQPCLIQIFRFRFLRIFQDPLRAARPYNARGDTRRSKAASGSSDARTESQVDFIFDALVWTSGLSHALLVFLRCSFIIVTSFFIGLGLSLH